MISFLTLLTGSAAMMVPLATMVAVMIRIHTMTNELKARHRVEMLELEARVRALPPAVLARPIPATPDEIAIPPTVGSLGCCDTSAAVRL